MHWVPPQIMGLLFPCLREMRERDLYAGFTSIFVSVFMQIITNCSNLSKMSYFFIFVVLSASENPLVINDSFLSFPA